MDTEKFGYPVFDGKDFGSWKFRLELILAERDLLEHSGKMPSAANLLDANWKKDDIKARSVIVKCLANTHIEYVRQETSAHGMLKALSDVFKRKGVAQERHLRTKLMMLKYTAKGYNGAALRSVRCNSE